MVPYKTAALREVIRFPNVCNGSEISDFSFHPQTFAAESARLIVPCEKSYEQYDERKTLLSV